MKNSVAAVWGLAIGALCMSMCMFVRQYVLGIACLPLGVCIALIANAVYKKVKEKTGGKHA